MRFEGSIAFITSPFQVNRLKKFLGSDRSRSNLLIIALRPRQKNANRELVAAISRVRPNMVIWIRNRVASVHWREFKTLSVCSLLFRLTVALLFPKSRHTKNSLAISEYGQIDKLFFGYAWGQVAETLVEKLPMAGETFLLDDGGGTLALFDALNDTTPWNGGQNTRDFFLARNVQLVTLFGDLLPQSVGKVRVIHQEMERTELRMEPDVSWIVGSKAPTTLTRGLTRLKAVREYIQVIKKIKLGAEKEGHIVQYFPHRAEHRLVLALLSVQGIKMVNTGIALEEYILNTRCAPSRFYGFPSTFFLLAEQLLPANVRVTVLTSQLWTSGLERRLQTAFPTRLTFAEANDLS